MSNFLIDIILFRKLFGDYCLKTFYICIISLFTIDFFVYIVLNFNHYDQFVIKVFYLVGVIIIYRFVIEMLIINFKLYSVFYNIALKFKSSIEIHQLLRQKETKNLQYLLKKPLNFFKFNNFYINWLVSLWYFMAFISVFFNNTVADSYVFDIGMMHAMTFLPDSIKNTSFFYLFDIALFLFSLRIYLEIFILSIRRYEISNIVLGCLNKDS